jgi:hypothetical protein
LAHVLDSRWAERKITEWVVNFAASPDSGWFAASHVARSLNLAPEAVRNALTDMTRDGLVMWVVYECPEHDFTLLRMRAEDPVGPEELVTCSGDDNGMGHEVHPSMEHAMVVFEPTEELFDLAKKERGSRPGRAPRGPS